MTYDCAIAISPATSMATIADYAGHPTTYLFGAVFALHLTDKAANADQNCMATEVSAGSQLLAGNRFPSWLTRLGQPLRVAIGEMQTRAELL
jgi:hypothetical protein